MTITFRTPETDIVEEANYRLNAFKFPSFDRHTVEQLLLLIHQWKHDAHFYKKQLHELTEPISDAGHTTADGLRDEIEQLRTRIRELEAQ